MMPILDLIGNTVQLKSNYLVIKKIRYTYLIGALPKELVI